MEPFIAESSESPSGPGRRVCHGRVGTGVVSESESVDARQVTKERRRGGPVGRTTKGRGTPVNIE